MPSQHPFQPRFACNANGSLAHARKITNQTGRIYLQQAHFSEAQRKKLESDNAQHPSSQTFIVFGDNDVDARKGIDSRRDNSGGQAGCLIKSECREMPAFNSPAALPVITAFHDGRNAHGVAFEDQEVQNSLADLVAALEAGHSLILPVDDQETVTIGTSRAENSAGHKQARGEWLKMFLRENNALVVHKDHPSASAD